MIRCYATARGILLALLALHLAGCSGMASWEPSPRGKGKVVYESGGERRPDRNVGADEHLVRSGDTMYAIAFRHSLDYRELAKWNSIGSDYLIFPGQVLRLTAPRKTPPKKIQTDDIESEAIPMDHELAKAEPITPDSPLPAPPPLTALPGEVIEPTGFEWTWPTNGIVIRNYAPAEGAKGLDFAGNIGQPVFAAAPGRIVYSGNALKGYGELIIIKHDDIHLSAYGYNRRRHVSEGDIVTSGQPIGEMGYGPENKPLLHFEIRERGKPTDPARLLPGKTARASN